MTEDGRAGSGTDRETLKAALKGLRTLKARVRELESASREAIAVVGLGLRLPGGIVDASTLWDALVEERDLVSRVPATRWSLDRYLDEDAPPGASGVVTSSWGGFLEQVDGFDPDAFGVSHREALSMDPQQRLLLHVAWEALEDAGLIGSMEGSRTGVYLGLALSDWSKRTLRNPDPTAQSPYAGTGVFQSVAAGRISYALGLTGPAIALDTACSSSLVAAHLAMRALRSGECDVALAGGANLLLSPDATMVFSQMGALSPDGRCKAFDADANGYVRSEGIGVLVLKRLTDAERDNDRILAVLRGSAVNQDGRSNGLTAPSSPAQAQLVRDALRDAGATPDDLGAIEAHGTGTPLGDPIEVRALKEVLGQTSEPVTLGSIKSNMGHAETAAGLAGLAKAVMMQRHQIVPRHLHFTRENPALKLEGTSLRVATEAIPLREGTLVGVSSFGMSGTNAHVLVGPAPAPAEVEVEAPAQVLLPLSAHSSDALAELGRRAAVCLQNSVRDLADHAWTAAMGRSLLRHRAVVAVDNSEEGRRQASEALEALGNGESHPCLVVGEKPRRRPKLGVVGDPEVLSVWGVVPAAHGTAEDLKAARCTHVVEASRGLLAVAEAVVLGAMLDWGMGLCGPRKRASWPLTPWSMKRFWLDDPHEALRSGTDGTLAKVAWHQVWEAMEVSRVGPEAATIMGEGRLADALRGAVDHADGGPAWVVISDASVLTDALATLQGTAGAAGLILDASDSIAAGAGRALAAQASLALGARWLGSVTCSPETDPELVWAAMAAARGQDLRCVDGQVEAQRMRSAPAPRAVPLATGVWWILGGLGAVGLEVAEHLVAQGVKQLVLSGRSKPSDAAKARVAALRASGADVQVLSVDIGDAAAMRSAVERLGPDLRGVVHAAGTVSDAPFEKVTSEDVMSAWAPKVLGFAHLVDALSGTSVADILAVGSISGWLGIPGQTAYAMANAGLEASVGEARAAGLPARVVSFGPWSIGMASDSVQRGLRALGIQPLAPSLALSGLWHEGAGYIHLDAERFCRTGRGPRVETLFGAAPADEGAVKVRWTGMALKRAIAAEVAAVLGRSEPVPFDRGFFDLGLDSMLAVALASALATTLERPIPPTAPFDHPDVNAMAAWLEASDAAVAGDADQPVVPQEGPIAVVGMACRVPGADTPDTFWDLLCRGEDMVGPVPASRWSADAVFDPTPGTPGHAYVREGGFLRGDAGDLAMFDAAAFGISPVEAASLDPQQRLLLEMAIEACDHAGVATDRLSGAAVGVFVGIGPSDYGRRFDASVTTDLYAGTGNEPSFAAGRVAYALGVRGPTLGLNTACSTSLVTTHLACQALRQGECDMALSGGVHLMLTPDTTVELSQLKALSPTARCHTFDASADGYARGEGAGMLLLKRLADAERDGDAVLAVIRATGVNHDGPSAGLTVPSGEAQERLLRETLQRAGLVASDIGHLEAHGTGTRLGDPIEMRAVKAVYGDRTADQPLAVSSIKTHIGHLELAAGVAGTIAAIQSIRHGALAPHLHLNTPNPDVPMDWPVHIPTERTPWAAPGPRRAAVSSFGLSGTNAHLILEQAPPDRREHSASDTGAPLVWPVSSATQLGVSLQISRLSEVLHTVAAPQAVQTLTHGRAHRAYRAAVVARTGEAARVAFDQLLSTDGSVRQVPPTPPVLVGLCTGQGSQYGRMATAWLASGGVVAETLREADALVKDLRGTSLLEVMAQDDDAVRRTEWAQPALVAFEVALGRWWAARGVEPELYVGHSIGEIAAAHLAGAFSFEDAMRLTCARGTAMGRLPSGGGMLAVDLSELQLTARLASGGAWEAVDLAAVNAPGSGVVSGPLEALNAIAAGLTDEGVRHRLLTVSHAFHSRLMDPALDAVEAAARAMTAQPTSRPIVSNLTGRPETQCWADPTYWRRQVRSAVRFAEAISATPEGAAFVEFGPHPVLLGLTRRQRPTALGVGSAHRDDVADREATEARLALARAEAWTQGLPIDLGVDAPEVPSVRLPVTAWHRTRHWVEVEHPAAQAGWSRDTAWFSTLKDDHADRAIEQVSVWDTRGQRDPHMALDAGLERLAHAQERGERVLLVHDASVVGQALLGLWRGVRVELAAHWGGTLEAAEGDEVGDLTALHGCAERVQTPAGLRVRTLHRQPLAGRPVIRGTWWIVGGLGAVGRAFARALASGGAERVVLSSRTEPSEEQHAWIADLRRDVDVDWKRLDVTDAAQVEAIAASLVEEGLHGVLHAAGRTQDRRLAHLTSDDMHAVWSAKVTGAQHLAAALTHHPLDAFVLLGSAAGRLGWGGQANYGAANAALLGVVRSRREAGQTAMLLSYGPWEGAGLANDQMRAAMSAAGMTALDPSGAARRGLGALSLDAEEVLIAGLDHEAYAARHPGSESLFGWPTDEQAAETVPVAPDEHAAHALDHMAGWVRAAVGETLGLSDADQLDAGTGLFDLGLDSLLAVRLAAALEQRIGRPVPGTVAFDHPTIDALITWGSSLFSAPDVRSTGGTGPMGEPIVLVGAACRFPGGIADLESFWAFLDEGGQAIGPIPADRWNADALYDPEQGKPGHSYVREGAFLDDVRGFEPAMFGISPREARRLDPQQRLLLELAWESFEQAGLAPDRLGGERVSVHVGLGGHDYERLIASSGPPGPDDAYTGTGNDPAFAAGRVSYVFGLQGPALTFNTACSSSLVALQLGRDALRAGQVRFALAGGVRMMLTPDETLQLSQLRALSPTARCHTFDAAADGYVRGEGGGLVLMCRLSTAEELGLPILAEVAGVSTNHDGTSGGLTVPSGEAQRRLMELALDDAGLQPDDVDVVEAHGTGTPLGDPIEVGALQRVFGQRDPARPLMIGSVKTNLGHLELAAGMAGLLKLVVGMKHERFPGQVGFQTPNPSLDLTWPVHIASAAMPWRSADGRRRIGGVSAFGLSGTNAHALLASREPVVSEPSPRAAHPLLLSSRTAEGLVAQARQLKAWLTTNEDWQLEDVAYTLWVGRAALPHRAAGVASTRADLLAWLDAVVTGSDEVEVGRGQVTTGAVLPPVGLLFTGQGSQYPGMARELYDRFPVFADVVDACDQRLRELRGSGLLAVLFADAEDATVHQTGWTQPALFAVEVGLARLWESWGVVPSLVLGHSVGEIAAAHVAGVLSLEDALTLVEARGRLMQQLPAGGGMGAIFAGEEAVLSVLQELGAAVDIASLNGPTETVVSGALADVTRVLEHFEGRGVRCKALTVSHAFHSRLMDPMMEAFRAEISGLTFHPATCTVVSNLSGSVAGPEISTVDYWVHHARAAVRFSPAIAAAVGEGITCFVEVGPHPVLAGLARRALPEAGLVTLPSLRRGQPCEARLYASIAALQAVRSGVDADAFWAGSPRQRVAMPGVAWQREPYWIDGAVAWEAPPATRWVTEWVPLTGAVGSSESSTSEGVLRVSGDPRTAIGELMGWWSGLGEAPRVVLAPATSARAVWGALACIRLEEPSVRVRLIECDDANLSPAHQALGDPRQLDEVNEDWIRITAAGAVVPRLRRASAVRAGWRPHGVVLITGGSGAVGAHLAAWCKAKGSRVMLASRSGRVGPGLPDDTPTVVADVSTQEGAVAAIEAARELGTLTAIIHAAGALRDGAWRHQTPDDLDVVWGPKVGAVQALAAAWGDSPPETLVLMSSAASLLGAPGQATYGAANGAMASVAAALPGVNTVTLHYGPWSGGGMATPHLDRMAAEGILPIAPDAGASALALAVAAGGAQAVVEADFAVFAGRHSVVREMSLWRDVVAPRRAEPAVAPHATPSAVAVDVKSTVRQVVASVLGMAADALDPGVGFFDLGLDSLMAVTVSERLEARLQREVPNHVLFDHPTVDRLSRWLDDVATDDSAAAVPNRTLVVDEDPIAIVGLGVRFPGAEDVPAFWDLLSEGRCAIGEAPRDRWPELDSLYDPTPRTPGKTYTTRGGFLEQIEDFDPAFFGISRREAEAMDPSQRLLLEVSWEALERAGISPETLSGGRTGVYVGLGASEYDARFQNRAEAMADPYSGPGNDTSFAAGRIAYVLGLHGPALAINTACSASLVTVELARRDLLAGRCELAIAGGVNLMVSSDSTVRLAQLGALSPEGLCKAFDASADGYVRGEGAGMVVLQRLSEARAQGRRVLAVLKGGAINHDGPASGLTVPHGPSQTALLNEAWAEAGIEASEIGVIEAHGTGTRLGDPIEARSLAAALGDHARGVMVGSVKSNIGHLELAAGIAGLAKAILSRHMGQIPAHLHLNALNPEIPADLGLEFPRTLAPWPAERPMVGVSSFGLSGTNAHLVLGPGDEAPEPEAARGWRIWGVSTRHAETLDATSRDVAMSAAPHDADAVAWTLAQARQAGRFRRVAWGEDSASLRAALAGASDAMWDGVAGHEAPSVAFLFTGQGSQYAQMATLDASVAPVAAGVWAEADALLGALEGQSLREAIASPEGQIHQTWLTQPALVVGAIAWARQWQAWGIQPTAVLGHSIGAIAAAHIAGALSFRDAVMFARARGAAMQALPEGGAMASLRASEAVVLEAMAGLELHVREALAVAAVNGPDAVVVSGSTEAVEQLASTLEPHGVTAKMLTVSHAFHSPLMAPAVAAVTEAAESVTWQRPEACQWVSDLTADVVPQGLTPEQWGTHVVSPVRFAEALQKVAALGCTVFIEVGPHPVLSGMARRQVKGCRWLASQHRMRGIDQVVESVAQAWTFGLDIDLGAWVPDSARRIVPLATTRFRRQRCWVELEAANVQRQGVNGPLAFALMPGRPSLPAPIPEAGSVVVLNEGAELAGLTHALEAKGLDVLVVGEGGVAWDGSKDALTRLVKSAPSLHAVVVCAAHELVASRLLTVLQASGDVPMVLMTSGAEAGVPQASVAGAVGLMRTARLERTSPHRWIDVAEASWDTAIPWIFADDDEVLVTQQEAHTLQLAAAPASGSGWQLGAAETVLVTGGLGALGRLVAEHLLSVGPCRVRLVSRSEPSAEARAWMASCNTDEERLSWSRCDVSDAVQVSEVFDALRAQGTAVGAVIHAAGVLDDRPLDALDPEAMARVAAAKVRGAHHLHEASLTHSVKHFVLFSSVSGMLGAPAQGAYAAANAAMDALAVARRSAGLPATSIAWGPWADVGMASSLAPQMRRRGVEPIRAADAMRWMDRLVGGPTAHVAVVEFVWSSLGAGSSFARRTAMEPLLKARGLSVTSESVPSRSPSVAAGGDLTALVRALTAEVLGAEPDELDAERPLSWQGLDSMMATDLHRALESTLGITLSLEDITVGPRLGELVQLAEKAGATLAEVPSVPTVSEPALAPPTPMSGPVSSAPPAMPAPSRSESPAPDVPRPVSIDAPSGPPSMTSPWMIGVAGGVVGAILGAAAVWLAFF